MKESNVRDLKSGESFTANIDGRIVSGKIQIHNNKLYLCQDDKCGASISDRLGFRYSWVVSHANGVLSDKIIADFDVKDLVIGTPTTGISYAISIDFKDIANKTPFIGTFRGREVNGIFYTSRKDGILYILSNEPTLYGSRGTYTYGYRNSFAIESIGGKIIFPPQLHLNFSRKGRSAVTSTITTVASIPPTIDPKKIATGTPFTAKFSGNDMSGLIYNNNQGRLFFLYNDGPMYSHTDIKLGYKYSFALRDPSSATGLIDTKYSYYEILTIGEPTEEMKRLWEIEASIPKESHPGGYSIQRQGNKYIFGCGEVELTYEELVTYVKVRRSIQRKIDRMYHDKIEVIAAALADPKMKEVIEKIK